MHMYMSCLYVCHMHHMFHVIYLYAYGPHIDKYVGNICMYVIFMSELHYPSLQGGGSEAHLWRLIYICMYVTHRHIHMPCAIISTGIHTTYMHEMCMHMSHS